MNYTYYESEKNNKRSQLTMHSSGPLTLQIVISSLASAGTASKLRKNKMLK